MNNDQKTGQDKNTTSDQTTQGQSQVQGIGSIHKEQGPIETRLPEIIRPSESSPKVSQELKDIGIQARSDDINLTDEHKKIGITHAGESVPVSTSPSSLVNLPMTAQQTKKKIKKTKPTDSLRGLLVEILKNIQRIGLKEQKV